MTVLVKRNGEWIEAPCYEVGDEILVGGHTPAVVQAVGVGEDGAPCVDVYIVLKRPAEFITLHFKKEEP